MEEQTINQSQQSPRGSKASKYILILFGLVVVILVGEGFYYYHLKKLRASYEKRVDGETSGLALSNPSPSPFLEQQYSGPRLEKSFFTKTLGEEVQRLGGIGTVVEVDVAKKEIIISIKEDSRFTFPIFEDTKIKFGDVNRLDDPVMTDAIFTDIEVGQQISVFRDPPESKTGGLVVIIVNSKEVD